MELEELLYDDLPLLDELLKEERLLLEELEELLYEGLLLAGAE